ncbi:hypothetical protein [Polaribacter aquimarinus]|uniref:Uncharacterized protein n=1 Tax=Polaribacter aquimarinus TaxID=2100726 RepID=A0A2U2JEN9_9FLAO|nr:hypothetical protein [Polaribacter aquimarinus]PWG06820.1 hypothetical protein DIS07_02995 [Polaribacter aquimarinus]
MLVASIPKNDLHKLGYIFLRKIGIFVGFIFMLFFDGIYFTNHFVNSQIPINILAIFSFFWMYKRAYPRVRKSMFVAVVLGLLGEYFFSVYLGMYTYRLENVPWYVPLGHAALYGRVLMFSKDALARKYHKAIEELFTYIILIFATIYLIFFSDIFGFLMTILVFLILYKRPKDRLYFYTMYIVVALLEIGGTAFGCWKWPPIAFGIFESLPSNNPPSGISLFYFLLDIGCFVFYILINNKAWKRLKRIRKSHI